MWPEAPETLESVQRDLAGWAEREAVWRPPRDGALLCAGTFITHPTAGADPDVLSERGPAGRGEASWAAAAVCEGRRDVGGAVVPGTVVHPYRPGMLALREGALLEAAVRRLPRRPEVVLVNATGLDHPRGAGLALHLGAALGIPTVGVTDRPLLGRAADPGPEAGAAAPLVLDGRLVGLVVRTRSGVRPVCVHAAWRTTPALARDVVLGVVGRSRTPEPIRRARFLARTRRATDEGRVPG